MTMLLLLEATDGLLALSDGRTTRTEPDGRSYPSSHAARKVSVAPGASIIAMASGRMNFTAQDVASIFDTALSQAAVTAAASGRRLSVRIAAQACFEALATANGVHEIPGEGVMAVVAGFDEEELQAQVYEFTVPDTSDGPRTCQDFARDRFLARPADNNSTDLVRGEFGFVTADQFTARIDEALHAEPDDSPTYFHGQFSLAGKDLHSIEAAVRVRLPSFLTREVGRLDQEGIGGHWTIYMIRPGSEVERARYSWGPMRV